MVLLCSPIDCVVQSEQNGQVSFLYICIIVYRHSRVDQNEPIFYYFKHCTNERAGHRPPDQFLNGFYFCSNRILLLICGQHFFLLLLDFYINLLAFVLYSKVLYLVLYHTFDSRFILFIEYWYGFVCLCVCL